MTDALTPQEIERAERADAARLTPSRLLSIKRIAEAPDFQEFWKLMQANFPLHDPVFVPLQGGAFDVIHAAKRDGQRDVMLFIALTLSMKAPATTEEAELE